MTNSEDPDQLLLPKPTDLGLHCLQRLGISMFSRASVNKSLTFLWNMMKKSHNNVVFNVG